MLRTDTNRDTTRFADPHYHPPARAFASIANDLGFTEVAIAA